MRAVLSALLIVALFLACAASAASVLTTDAISPYRAAFEQFKLRYNKKYSTAAEEQQWPVRLLLLLLLAVSGWWR